VSDRHPHRCACGKAWTCGNTACHRVLYVFCRNQDPKGSGQPVACANLIPQIQVLARLENLLDFLGSEAVHIESFPGDDLTQFSEALTTLAGGLAKDGERSLAVVLLALRALVQRQPAAAPVLKARARVLNRMREISAAIEARP